MRIPSGTPAPGRGVEGRRDVERPEPQARTAYRWTRDLHLYLGLFLSPFVVLYALSAILLAHAWDPRGSDPPEPVHRRTVVALPEEENSLVLAKLILAQTGLSGEVGWLDRRPREGTLSFPVIRPGEEIMMRVDLNTGVTQIEQSNTGTPSALVLLHRKPGPHNVALRGNWLPLRVWAWLADATAYLLILLSVTGIYLWLAIRAERRAGLVFLGAGALSFVLLVLAVAP